MATKTTIHTFIVLTFQFHYHYQKHQQTRKQKQKLKHKHKHKRKRKMTGLSPENLISAQMHVTITDCRNFDGILTAIDPFGNLLLSETYEISKDKFDDSKVHQRKIRLVSIPRSTIKSIKVDKRTHERIFKS